MMSAHDVAVAALSEVAAHQRSESRVGTFAIPRSADDTTAASIKLPTKNAPTTELGDSNALIGFQSSSSNNSQTTNPEATTPPTSDGFSSQSQPSPSRLSHPSQTTVAHSPLAQLADAAFPSPTVASNAGQKRTFDGYVKPTGTSSSSSASPPIDSSSGHSRGISSSSATSSLLSSREVRSFLCRSFSVRYMQFNWIGVWL